MTRYQKARRALYQKEGLEKLSKTLRKGGDSDDVQHAAEVLGRRGGKKGGRKGGRVKSAKKARAAKTPNRILAAKRGGRSTSPKKLEAARRNAEKARKIRALRIRADKTPPMDPTGQMSLLFKDELFS